VPVLHVGVLTSPDLSTTPNRQHGCKLVPAVRPKTKFHLLAVVGLFVLAVQAPAAQQPSDNARTKYFIDRVDLVGNRRVRSDTLLALIRPGLGAPYSVEEVRRDVRSLWNTGFFDDVRSEVEDSPDRPNGKIVILIVRGKPIVASIDYKGLKSIAESDILAALKDQKVKLSVGDWFDEAKMKRAVTVITQLLASHGYQSVAVKPTYERIASSGTVTVTFNIDEGPKTKKSR
jgi:outer membrane protein insertion porin family